MHPAPSLLEAFPKSEDSRAQQGPGSGPQQPSPILQPGPLQTAQQEQQQPQEEEEQQYQNHHQPNGSPHQHSVDPNSPISPTSRSPLPVRKDTGSSISTNESDATITTNASNGTDSSAYSVESSQSIFSVKDGAEVSSNRRASRRRTGPLSAQQREKAALIRKLGACADCRRRRVACHPNHHNMTWEDAMRKYRSHSPMQELAPLAGRPLSPAQSNGSRITSDGQQRMDVDSSPTPPANHAIPGRPHLSDARIRTPLPSGPRLEKMPPLAAAPLPPTTLPTIDFLKSELDTSVSRMLSGPNRARYTRVMALLVCWQDDEDPAVASAVEGLSEVLDKYYRFGHDIVRIPPSSSSECTNSSRWLSRTINEFTDNSDTRDVLKLVYYIGGTYLDDNREMNLVSGRDRDGASTIRWGGIQQTLEEACSDTLIIMDAAYYHPYYHPSKIVRHRGVLELIAASSSEEHMGLLGRGSFTRAFADFLRLRALKRLPNALSVAELHSELLSSYSRIIAERHPEREAPTNPPSPLHLQVSGNSRLPSITLSPLQERTPVFSPETPHGSQLNLSIRLTDDTLNIESWNEWFRLMPEEIRDVKVEGPYRTFR